MRKLLVLWIAVLQLSCNQTQKPMPYAAGKNSSAYQLCKINELPGGIQLQLRLDTARQEDLLLTMHIKNTTDQPLPLQLFEAALLTPDLRRHTALKVNPELNQLAAGAEQVFTWEFRPINDLYLYQHSGLHGSWHQQYRLPLFFIGGLVDTVSFCFPEQAYLDYSIDAAAASPRLYKPAASAITPQAAARQEKYWASLTQVLENAEAGSAYFSEQEFFTAGINVRQGLYQKGDSLFLRLQLTNHAPYELQITPAAIQLWVDEQTIKPLKISNGPVKSAGATYYTVRRGDRLPLTMVYALPAADSLDLDLAGIVVMPMQKPLFGEKIRFVKQ